MRLVERKVLLMKMVYPRTLLASGLLVSATFCYAAPPILRWNGAPGGLWDATTANWLDADDSAVAWQPGAEAQFDGAGGLVNVAADVTVSNITFAANGYTLLGAGRLTVEGTLAVATATTNSVTAELLTGGGLAKTGPGALALARCAGPLAVQEGALLVSGSLFTDADLSVASGASVVTLGDPDDAANLLFNPGFEYPAITNSPYWSYVSAGNVISNWTVTANSNYVGRQSTAVGGSPWNSVGTSPEGTHMLIVQYNGAVAQTVTVPANGVYSVAFTYLLRNTYPENQVYVTLDGVPLASFLNRSPQARPGRFASGALWLAAGSHTLGLAGEGGWADRASMIDAVCFAAPSAANAGRAFGGDAVLRAVTGSSVVLNHSGTLALDKVSLDGVAASGTFAAAHASGLFSGGGSLSCSAPANFFEGQGLSGDWSSAGFWSDGAAPAANGGVNLKLAFPSAASTLANNGLAGAFTANRLRAAGLGANAAFTLTGNALNLTNGATGTNPKLTLAAPGAWTVENALLAQTTTTFDVSGTLTLSSNLAFASGSYFLCKTGPGTLALPALTNCAAPAVYEGTLKIPVLPANLAANLYSQSGKPAVLCLTRGGQTHGGVVSLLGSGLPTLATRCGGGTVTLSNWANGPADTATFDVGENDTLSLRQLVQINTARVTALVKSGPGTLEIRSGGADAGNNRAYFGATTLRCGTLTLSEDDFGPLTGVVNPFNGRTYNGNGGSLGAGPLTNAVRLGDSGTAPSDTLKLVANGAGRWLGHDIEVFNRGSAVTLASTTGTVQFAGTVTLHRDIALAGPADGVMSFSNVVAAADFSGTGLPALTGLAGLRFEGAFPAAASLVMNGRSLSFGTYAVRSQTLSALVLGSAGTPGALAVDFGGSANDTIAVTASDGLTLSNTVVSLYCVGSGLPFAEPGTYTLFTYSGTLGGSAALLSLGNPQAGATYAFSNDTDGKRVLLTISKASGSTAVIWKHAAGGDWATGANWDSGTAPDAPGLNALFGTAIAEPATVALGSSRTLGGLTFNNAFFGYTLSGGSLTLNSGGPMPALAVLSGTHTLDTALLGSDGVSISAAANAALVLGSNATVGAALTLATGLVRSLGPDAAVASLSGSASATLELAGAAPKLTVNQAAPGTFAGALSGGSGAQFVKDGSGTLTLSRPLQPFLGQTAINAGTLALKSSTLPAALSVGPAGTLGVLPAATNGLTGYFYPVTPATANFATLAALESHFAALTPDLVSVSGVSSNIFDFGVGTAFFFPAPYNPSGSRPINFEAVWRGTITVPLSGTYTFGVSCDDGFLLAIDGQTVMNRLNYTGAQTEGTVRLDAGRYDLVLGYFQITGGGGLRLTVRLPGSNGFVTVPSSWLTPYSASGTLTGTGALAANASNALFRTTQAGGQTSFGGDLAGASGSLLAKSGAGTLLLTGSSAVPNAFAGDLDVQAGSALLLGGERLGDAAVVRVRSGAALSLAGAETAGSLAGGGALSLGSFYTCAFTGDADSDISTAKTYTHLQDFPTGSYVPVINGVSFGNVGTLTGTLPGTPWNNAPLDSARSGIDSLLWDFSYNSPDFTFDLAGLTPGQPYEARLYFRSYTLGATRNVTFTFSSGATPLGSYTYNIDAVQRSWLGCRYVAGATGTLTVRVVSVIPTTTCHLYGLSNEQVADASLTPAALTVTPAAGKSDRFTGPVSGFGTLIKAGAGTQRFSGANTLQTPLDVQAGRVTLDPGATLLSGAVVRAGATLAAPLGNVTLGSLAGAGTFNLSGSGIYTTNAGPYFVTFTNDAGTGISPDKTYTHLLDFGPLGNPLAVVNGVAFDKVTSANGPIAGYGWTNFPTGTAANTPPTVPASSGIYKLLYDLNYNMVTGVVRLTGLTVGKRYEVRLYNRIWSAGNRTQVFLFDPDGTGPLSDAVTFNPDQAGSLPNFLAYRYTAATNYLALTVQLTVATYAYHFYGLSNEEVIDSQNGPATLDIATACVFDGAVAGPGGWTKTGAGTLTVTGSSTNTGPLTVSAGAFGAASGGRATAGPVSVASGATLFGDGRMGGSVTVASNAWLHAGTPAACGTLQVVGDLALAPGARPKFRFTASASDAVTVGGRLTIPTNGVLQAQTLTAGVKPPAKTAVFTSAQVISGPATLDGWTVVGADNCTLSYNDDKTIIYLRSPRGTMILIR